jgi:hypothetical protein
MDDSSYRQNFDLDKNNEIHYHGWREHLQMSNIAKFFCELLYNEENNFILDSFSFLVQKPYLAQETYY